MNHAQMFAAIMSYLWGDDADVSFVVRAIGDRIKGTQRCNYENALDVRHVVFGESKAEHYVTQDNVLMFDVTFSDASRAIISCVNGIGSSAEPIT